MQHRLPKIFLLALTAMTTFMFSQCQDQSSDQLETGNVIFIHPDGSGYNVWAALRLLKVGPDSDLSWDQMSHLGVYRSHQLNGLGTSSNAGATAHAFGVKAEIDDYGIDPDRPFNALSGKPLSIMAEAQSAGIHVGLINSGHINEPGTGVFLANVKSRQMNDAISLQLIQSKAELLLSGGEVYLLPQGMVGHHGKEGLRQDGRNLIAEAQAGGYTVIYDKQQLSSLDPATPMVLGVFAAKHTFNDRSEEDLQEAGLPQYNNNAPSLADMTQFALKFFETRQGPFFLVIEEEGTDNFGNANNASGMLNALGRADDAIGLTLEFIEQHPNTLLVTASDSDAGGLQVHKLRNEEATLGLPPTVANGAPVDGQDGTSTLPFMAQPDQFGQRMPFFVSWACYSDVYGGVVAKAHGLNAQLLPVNVDNTDIYRIMYATLFGKWLD